VILAAEILDKIVPLLENSHPIKICKILTKAKNICIQNLEDISKDVTEKDLLAIVKSSVATKLCTVLNIGIPELALKAAQMISEDIEINKKMIDLKTNLKIDKI